MAIFTEAGYFHESMFLLYYSNLAKSINFFVSLSFITLYCIQLVAETKM